MSGSWRLKQLRTMHNLTQQDVSARLNIPVGRYRNYESGKCRIPLGIFEEISILYGVSMDYLAGRTNNADLLR